MNSIHFFKREHVCSHRMVLCIPLCLLLTAFLSASAYAQVSLSTSIVFVCDEAPTSTLTIYNTSARTKEVAVSMDANPLVKLDPQQFVLQPGERQQVSFTALAPANTDTASYPMRVRVTSMVVAGASGPTANHENTTTWTSLEEPLPAPYVQSIPLLYLHGTAVVTLSPRAYRVQCDSVHPPSVFVETGPTGNAPFIGMLGMLITRNDVVVTTSITPVSLFENGHIRLLPIDPDLPNGEYRVQLLWILGRENVLVKYSERYETIVDSFTLHVGASGAMAVNQ